MAVVTRGDSSSTRRSRSWATLALGSAVAVMLLGVSALAAGVVGPATVDESAVRGRAVRVGPIPPPPPTEARYRVTIVQEWSRATHPSTVPPGWHTSPAVLAAHVTPGDMVPVGGAASPGIESMAETGRTSILRVELSADSSIGDVDFGRGIAFSGSDELEVVATQATPYLSLVSMLAPSPDWFVGFHGVPVFEVDRWRDRAVLDLVPYDAGTDSGTGFTSGDVDTQPRQPIGGPRDAGYVAAANEGRFGYVVIERIG